ncbi:MAG: NAD-dependent epimerase/dehydratase family protein [Bacteroidota bacterium]
MRLFLTGGTGFVGTYVSKALLDAGHTLRCLVRGSGDGLDVRGRDGVEVVQGDILQPDTLGPAMASCDGVVHLVGIIEESAARGVTFERIHHEGTANVVAAAKAAGVQRFVHMSANGAAPDGVSAYQTSKWAGEEAVRAAGFAHAVIFRPSVIFGDPGPGRPEFCAQLWRDLVKPFPILPILGDGQYELQPIHVTEVAAAFAQAVTLDAARGQAYCVAGTERVTFDETVDRIARGAGIDPKPKLHQPLWLARLAVNTAGRAGLLPISPAQFAMLIAGNTCDAARFRADFATEGVPFTPDSLAYLRDG